MKRSLRISDAFNWLEPGVKSIIESIDNRADFKVYMHNYAFAHGGTHTRGPRREGPKEDGFVSSPLRGLTCL